METFPLADFRLLYPQFDAVPDDVVNLIASQALCYIGIHACNCGEQGWMLLVAHMLFLRESMNGGTVGPGALASATIGSVSVSFQAPSSTDGWSHWLNQSPFGQQFIALTKACFGGAMYIGGLPERSAFRSVGGIFPGRRWLR